MARTRLIDSGQARPDRECKMVSFPIVDSHVHLYDPGRFPYTWMKDVRKLNRPHLPADYLAAIGTVSVERIVFVEVWVDKPHQMAEAEWVSGLVESMPQLRGIVASVSLEEGAGIEGDLAQLAGMEHVKAVRRLIQFEPAIDFCLQPGFIEGVRLLAKYDLSFDICVKHHQLANAVELVRRCPEVRFVLDHIGKPPIEAGEFDPWREDLRAMAALPNVCCKISGVITEADHDNWTREQLRPYLDHAIGAFGIDRVMFGSDWSVSTLTHGYEEWVDIVEWTMSGSSESEMSRLFRDNAISFYRLP